MSDEYPPSYLVALYEARTAVFNAKLEQLAEISKVNGIWNEAPRLAANQEYRTVRMAFGRRTGASHWLAKSDFPGSSVIFVHSLQQVHFLIDYMRELGRPILNATTPVHCQIFTLQQLKREPGLGQKADFAFFDVSCFIPDSQLRDFSAKFEGRLIVLL